MPRAKKILGPVVKTTALIPEPLYRELLLDKGGRVAETINEGLEMLAASRRKHGGEHTLRPVPAVYKEANQPWHKKLETVLNEGTARDRTGIEQNLEWADDSIRRRLRSKAKAAF